MRIQLDAIVRDLKDLDGSFVVDGVSSHYLATRKGGGGEVVVEANVAGLVHLAAVLTALAQRRFGASYTLDEAGMADAADPPIEFVFKPAEWD